MLFFPLLLILTPSPTKSTQSILYALSAPVRHGPIKQPAPVQLSHPDPAQPGQEKKKTVEEEVVDPNRSGVGGGDVVRDCAVVEYVLPSSFFLLFFHLACFPCPSTVFAFGPQWRSVSLRSTSARTPTPIRVES